MSIGIKAKYMILEPTTPGLVPNGAVFIDSSNANVASVKNMAGTVDPVGSTSSSNLFIKQMQASGPIATNAAVSKRADGKIEQSDSDSPQGQHPIGYTMQEALADGDLVNVLTVGANIVNAIAGKGFVPGEDVFISETGGYTNDPNSFTGNNDSIIKVGIADCLAGVASPIATDLVAITQVLLRP